MTEAIAIRDEVAEALNQGSPVVALESTLIAHGLPYPDNLELAREVEGLVRREGAVPATIGVIGGVPKVGLGPQELKLMSTGEGVAIQTTNREGRRFESCRASFRNITVCRSFNVVI